MTKLSDIKNIYGKQFSIAIANTYSYNVLKASNLPKNTIIITAPFDSYTYKDIDASSILITDSYGYCSRITYAIKQGNGLYADKDGILTFDIDYDSLRLNNKGEIEIDISKVINNTFISYNNGKLYIDTENIPKATKTLNGTIKVDGKTIRSNNGLIYVDTESLDLSNNSSSIKGIVKSDNNTISINNGIISVNTHNLEKASNISYGVFKVDGSTIKTNNDSIYIDINSLEDSNDYTIAKPDNVTTIIDQNNILKVNYSGLRSASSTQYGVIKPDNTSLVVSNDGTLMATGLIDSDYIEEMISNLNQRVLDIENSINYNINTNAIYTFVCNGISSAILVKSKEYGEFPEKMPVQKVSAQFTVNTNCPFKIRINYFDNISPEISLYEINYNDVDIYPGMVGLSKTYQSTEEKDVNITLYWLCKNYRSNNTSEYFNKTRILIEVYCATDNKVIKHVNYSITRFNSLYNEQIDYTGQNDDLLIDKYKNTPIVHRLDLALKVADFPGGRIENDVITASSDVYKDFEGETKSKYILGEDYEGDTTTYSLVSIPSSKLGQNASINNIIKGLQANNLKVSAFEVKDGHDIPTREVSMNIDNTGHVILSFNGRFDLTKRLYSNMDINGTGLNENNERITPQINENIAYDLVEGTYLDADMMTFVDGILKYNERVHLNNSNINVKVFDENNNETNDAELLLTNEGLKFIYKGRV